MIVDRPRLVGIIFSTMNQAEPSSNQPSYNNRPTPTSNNPVRSGRSRKRLARRRALLAVVMLLVLSGGLFAFFRLRSGQTGSGGFTALGGKTAIVHTRSPEASGSFLSVNQQPFVTLQLTDQAAWELQLRTLPLSAGPVYYRLTAEGQEPLSDEFNLQNFPFISQLTLNTSANSLTGVINIDLVSSPPYQTGQFFDYYPRPTKQIQTADNYFSLNNADFEALSGLLLVSSAGLPGELPDNWQPLTGTQPLAETPSADQMLVTASLNIYPLAYQISVVDRSPLSKPTEVTFTYDRQDLLSSADETFVSDQEPEISIWAFDLTSSSWQQLETTFIDNSNGSQYKATSENLFDLYVLALR